MIATLLLATLPVAPVCATLDDVELEKRWNKVCASLGRNRSLSNLNKLARSREALDAVRAEALALIEDEQTYFYPFKGPSVPSEKQREYRELQELVDERLEAVHDAWDDARTFPVPDGLRELLLESRACQRLAREAGAELAWPDDVPAWAQHLPTDLERIGVGDFAWDAREAAQLERNRAVRALNAARWDADDGELADDRAAEQVRVTNDYRVLLGRPALVWSPVLQRAATEHSGYMAETGNFGHVQSENPGRERPMDRARAHGYTGAGVSENVSQGRRDARSALEGWQRSSGHHRNMIDAGHREMASAVDGRYWTQNFGTATTADEELEAWFD